MNAHLRPAPTRFPLSAAARNLVRAHRRLPHECLDESFAADFGYRARLSRFAILKEMRGLPGPDECFSCLQQDSRRVFAKTLGMEVRFPDVPAGTLRGPTAYQSVSYHRSHLEELVTWNAHPVAPPLEVECRVCYIAADRLLVDYRLRNRGEAPLLVELAWSSRPDAGLELRAAAEPTGFTVAVRGHVTSDFWSCARLVSAQRDVAFAWDGAAFASAPLTRTIAGGESRHESFLIAFDGDEAPSVSAADIPADPLAACTEAMAEIEAAYARLPALDAAFAMHKPLTLTAAGILLANRFLDRAPDGTPVPVVQSGKTGLAATWWWDTGATLVGLGLIGERAAVAGSVMLLLDGLGPDGEPPCRYVAGQFPRGYQQPNLAWGLWHYHRACPDPELLARAYPALVRYVDHWLRDLDADGDGLPSQPDGCPCWDDSLRWQDQPVAYRADRPWWRNDFGGHHTSKVANVDTCTHLHLELRALAEIARLRGEPEAAAEHARRAEQLAKLINERLFDARSGTYQDRHERFGFTGQVTPASFLPVYAGIAPREAAQAMCRRWLLDPAHFATPLPFPTLDRAHPSFKAGGWLYTDARWPGSLVPEAYWVGRVWTHVSLQMLGALHRCGLEAEAEAMAQATLSEMAKNPSIYECYDPLSGAGLGHAEFSWGAAAALGIAYRTYEHAL